MKSEIKELAVAGTAAVAEITPKIISNVIEEIARDNVVWAQFYRVNTDLMRNGGTEVVFPKKGSGVSAAWGLTQGQGLTATGMTFSGVTIGITKGGVGIGLYGEAIRQTNRDVISDNLEEAGMTWADTVDIAAFEAMFPTATLAITGGGTFANATAPIMGIKSVAPSTVSGVTIVNTGAASSITWASSAGGTAVFWYVPNSCAYSLATSTASSLGARDVQSVRNAIRGYKFKPKVLVAHPEMITNLLYDPATKFLEQAAYTGSAQSHAYTGEIGQLLSLRVITTVYAPTIAVAVIDTDKLGYQVVRKNLEMKEDMYTGMSLDALYYWGFAEKGFGVVNGRSYGAVVVKGTYTVATGLGSGYP